MEPDSVVIFMFKGYQKIALARYWISCYCTVMEKTAKAAHAVELIQHIIAEPEYLEYYFGPTGVKFLGDGGFHTLISLIHIEKGMMMDEDERKDLEDTISALETELSDRNTELSGTQEDLKNAEEERDEVERRRQIFEDCLTEIDDLLRKVL